MVTIVNDRFRRSDVDTNNYTKVLEYIHHTIPQVYNLPYLGTLQTQYQYDIRLLVHTDGRRRCPCRRLLVVLVVGVIVKSGLRI